MDLLKLILRKIKALILEPKERVKK